MKEIENRVFFCGKSVNRRSILTSFSSLAVLGAVTGTKKLFDLTPPPLPPCLDNDGDDISFKVIPCSLPVPLVLGDAYSDPIKASQELLKLK